MHCLVVGNGESRRGINISKFSNRFETVGCNAIHRDFKVDHLVCCDRRMVDESVESDNTKDTKIYVREEWYRYYRKVRKDKRIQVVPSIPYQELRKQDKPINWGSGTYAILVAANLNPKSITLLGFDLYPIDDKVNNVYKGTVNYSSKDSKPIDHSYWEYQIFQTIKNFPEIEFRIYNKHTWKLPKSWNQDNVYFENFDLIKDLTLA